MGKSNAESPKQGSKRFNYNAKTKYIADLGIIYLQYAVPVQRKNGNFSFLSERLESARNIFVQ